MNLITPALIQRQVVRLAHWQVQTLDPRALAAGRALTRPLPPRWFDALCDAVEDVIAVAACEPVHGPDIDADRADLLAREAYEDALAPLVDAATIAARIRRTRTAKEVA